ncbi:hypothetical protein APHAL10511_004723 [Amanita phalloides]|nr:hypothetical protein APHAL10511_004723 [Amanita phalloides]
MTVVHEASAVAPRIMLNADKPGRPEKHNDYYMQDGNVVIQVEDTLFKLDLSVLHAKSPVFRIIVPPVYDGRTRYTGFDDKHPFVLREISAIDFERLLWVLYPLKDSTKQPATVEDWLSILKLSTKFQIDDIRPLAASNLHSTPIDPIRKITIWDEYHLDPKLLISSYVALCQRTEPLTLSMTMALGLKNFTRLAAARDIYHYNSGCFRCNRKTGSKERYSIAQAAVISVFLPPASPINYS